MNEDKIVIHQTRKNRFFLMLGAIIMSSASLVLALLPTEVIAEILGSQRFFIGGFRAFMLFGALFFGVCLIFIARTEKSKQILIVDETGFVDYTTIFRFGFIPWHDVDDMYLRDFHGHTTIAVELKHDENLFNRLGKLKTMEIKSNRALGFPSLLINLTATDVKPEVLLLKMNDFYKASK
ncbi:MAG: hypothetical protein FWD00_01630 [Clostridiales bacterium]|nr:hypothetical protein [Clostridiales bacterium]